MPTFDAITDAAIVALVDRFYTKARLDPDIGPLFNNAIHDWDEHQHTLYDFWSSVMLTTGRYKGNPMAAHVKHPIEPDFFDRWLLLWRETASELFAPAPAAEFGAKAERIAESLKLALFFRPGTMCLGQDRVNTSITGRLKTYQAASSGRPSPRQPDAPAYPRQPTDQGPMPAPALGQTSSARISGVMQRRATRWRASSSGSSSARCGCG